MQPRMPESSASVLSPVKADLLKYYQKHGLEHIAKEVYYIFIYYIEMSHTSLKF